MQSVIMFMYFLFVVFSFKRILDLCPWAALSPSSLLNFPVVVMLIGLYTQVSTINYSDRLQLESHRIILHAENGFLRKIQLATCQLRATHYQGSAKKNTACQYDREKAASVLSVFCCPLYLPQKHTRLCAVKTIHTEEGKLILTVLSHLQNKKINLAWLVTIHVTMSSYCHLYY